MTDVRHVNAHLVRTPRLQPALHHAGPVEHGIAAPVGDRRLPPPGVDHRDLAAAGGLIAPAWQKMSIRSRQSRKASITEIGSFRS